MPLLDFKCFFLKFIRYGIVFCQFSDDPEIEIVKLCSTYMAMNVDGSITW